MSAAPSRGGGSGSGGLAPSKSTVYVSNLPFSLTNNDLHKIFEKYGRIGKVTVVRDKESHLSKGVAFVLFIERESAYNCIKALNDQEMFGRTLRCSIAKDNGRASEFIRRKVYKDKVRCFECGEEGHLSYACPSNLLGEREPPPKKDKKKKRKLEDGSSLLQDVADSDDDDVNDDDDERRLARNVEEGNLAAAISYQQQQKLAEEVNESYPYQLDLAAVSTPPRKKYKKDSYFSDEEELD